MATGPSLLSSFRPLHGSLRETTYTPKLAGVDDLGSSLITLEVHLERYRANLRAILALIAPARMIAVVKANAYGFGVSGLIPILSEFEQISLGVATADEALELRALGYDGTVILLGYTHPKCYYQIVQSGCELSAYLPQNIPPLVEACRGLDHRLGLHIKVDTGLTRMGVPVDELASFIRELRAHPEIDVVGLFSHLVNSNDHDAPINEQQALEFARAVEIATAELGYRPLCHLGNSSAALNFPELHLDAVRIGLLAFGVYPPGDFQRDAGVEPCFRLTSEVIDVHRVAPGQGVSYGHSFVSELETTIVTLPFGYADGMPRRLSNQCDVLINGRTCPQVGTVTMDYIMADVGDDPVAIGDEVVLVGKQGDSEVTIYELAAFAETIPYELTCAWGRRVRRVYLER
jgi:alanine racemase